MAKIILNDKTENSSISDNSKMNNHEILNERIEKPNLFNGRPDFEINSATFPSWDILPPNQFINPRIKK
jgi:hypothetical protein